MTGDLLMVWLNDRIVGRLRRDTKGFTFEADSGARLLTVATQGSAVPWSREFTRNWFDNLLPDSALRQTVADAHGVSPTDLFALLAAIGWECAGAVSVLPAGRVPASGSYRLLTPEQLWARLDVLPYLVAGDEVDVHMSLGGAQEKLLLYRSQDGWHLPIDGAVSTHILKPEPKHYPGLAFAEAMCLLAASAATPTARAEVMTASGHRPTLVVERFDRETTGGTITRIHQEDGCQILGLPASKRFALAQASPARASYAAIAHVLVRRASDPAAELGRLLEQMTVNLALGNHDAHGKNYSVLHCDGAISLAPLYDVSPTRPFTLAAFDKEARYTAMLIEDRRVFDSVTRGNLLREASRWGVPQGLGRRTIEATLSRLADGVATARTTYPLVSPAALAAIDANLARVTASDW